MHIFKFLLRGSLLTIVLSGLIGLVAGVSGIGLIHLVRHSIRGRALPDDTHLRWFIGLCIVMLISRALSQFIMTRFTEKTVSRLLRHLCREILRVPLRTLELFGVHRLQAILNRDVATIGKAMNAIPILCIKFTIVVCGLAYLAYLSPKLFGCLLGFGIIGGGTYLLVARRARRLMRKSRQDQNALHRHVRQMLRGLKELKLHRGRQEDFIRNGIEASDELLRRRNIRGARLHAVIATFGRILALVAIGLLLFVWPHYAHIDGSDLFIYGFILMITLRLGSSVASGLKLLFGKARNAVKQLERLGITVGEFAEEASLASGEKLSQDWRRLELVGVTHSYRDDLKLGPDNDEDEVDAWDDPNADPTEEAANAEVSDESEASKAPARGGEENNFMLGPINLTVQSGEIVFIVGGNGSGKSTLMKVLCGLYYPEAGEIRLDGLVIDVSRREAYRQLFSSVFDDVVLFDNLWGIDPAQVDERARRYLQAFHLDREVVIENGQFSTTEALSQGQRKRLALIATYLEDRPIYCFDEWAANQDPLFKRVFYTAILPDLKARGRTVIVVTHDDNYFHVADRIIVLRDGKVVEGGWQDLELVQRGYSIEAIYAALGRSGSPLGPGALNDGAALQAAIPGRSTPEATESASGG